MLSEILFFLLGCLIGWLTNHWYSVVLRQPHLVHNGGGGGGPILNSGYRYIGITVDNELRRLGISLPETVISLIVFLKREEDPGQYIVYQPTSETDPTPKTSGVPKFTETTSFFIQVRYSHYSQTLRIPVKITKRYTGSQTETSRNGLGTLTPSLSPRKIAPSGNGVSHSTRQCYFKELS
jgi:hypothetical protein